MADIHSTKEFLSEMQAVVDERDSAASEQEALSKELKKLRSSYESLRSKADKEKTDSVLKRRNDLKAGYDKQLKKAQSELNSAKSKRDKELSRLMKERAKASTEPSRQRAAELKEELKTYGKEHSLPSCLTGRAFYTLFYPGVIGYIVLIALFIILLFFSAGMTIARVGAGGNAIPFIALLFFTIALFAAYLIIWARTAVRYHEDIAACRAIIKDIEANETKVKNIEKSIQKAGDDQSYELGEFDDELKQKQAGIDEIKKECEEALGKFDSETAPRQQEEIEKKYAEELSSLSRSISDDEDKLSLADSRLTDAERRLTQDFVSHVGADAMTHDKIEEMIDYLGEHESATLEEALTSIKTKK